MPGSTWAQKLSGSTVLFVVALVCFIVGWVTNLKALTTIAYILFIVVALMGLYALCCTTKFVKGTVIATPEHTTVVHLQHPSAHPSMAPVHSPPTSMPPTHTAVPGFRPQYHPQDQPPPYSAAVKQNFTN
ncbi:uncharacterized protein LOC100900091 [Galendromus occidentalis]|uniref:Uncharacterized protein LOC100900091 n=1 Tax=Galendromus occidentalis TaxID=34638 RepID=A0AAJ7SHY7_9ACAR|nr:uncharacterized protein LOC100900091 [Galendromus occidentalis]